MSWELGKEDLSVRELNRNPVGKLGCLHERGEAGRGSNYTIQRSENRELTLLCAKDFDARL